MNVNRFCKSRPIPRSSTGEEWRRRDDERDATGTPLKFLAEAGFTYDIYQ